LNNLKFFFRDDIVLYRGESYRVEVFNLFSRFADITKDERSYHTIHESELSLLFRGARYYGERVENFYDDCLDRYNILSYDKDKESLMEIMKIIKILECD